MASRRPARWRTASRFLIRSLDLRASSFALALGAVAVGAAVTATTLNLRADLERKMTRELRAYGANLLVSPPLDGDAGGATLDGAWARGLGAALPDGVEAVVSPFLLHTGRAGGAPVTLLGVDWRAQRELATSWRVQGRWPDAAGSCLVGTALAAELRVAPGDRLTVAPADGAPARLDVAAVIATGESEDDAVLVDLAWLQGAAGRPGRVSAVALAVEAGPGDVEALAARLESTAPFAVEARPLLQVSRAQGALLGKLNRMMTLLTGVVLLLAGMCVMTTLMSIVVEREPEIGLMRSLGAGDAEVLRMLLGEATLLALLGGAAGLGLGLLGARWIGLGLFGTAASPRPGVALWVLAITLALCWLAVVLPLRRALAVQPATALRGS